ncbi:MAG: hypothetical protein D6781_00640 [Verrucomicrobia bacterium]|nr:MAG: hypothetical protein D6781_00640 [Verrucomicrobiota bacterium]
MKDWPPPAPPPAWPPPEVCPPDAPPPPEPPANWPTAGSGSRSMAVNSHRQDSEARAKRRPRLEFFIIFRSVKCTQAIPGCVASCALRNGSSREEKAACD